MANQEAHADSLWLSAASARAIDRDGPVDVAFDQSGPSCPAPTF